MGTRLTKKPFSVLSKFAKGALYSITLAALLFPISGRCQSLEKLEAVVKQAKDLDDLLSRTDLLDQYYEALAKYYGGKDKLTRPAFDAIIGQLRDIKEKVPELKSRLWETANIGTGFTVRSVGSSVELKLDTEAWNKYLAEWKEQLKISAEPILSLPSDGDSEKIRKAKSILDSRNAKIEAFQKEVSNVNGRKQRTIQTAAFYKELRGDSELQAACSFLILHGLERPDIKSKLAANNPDVLLYELNKIREHPQLLVSETTLPEGTNTFFKERIPQSETLMKQNSIITKPDSKDAEFSKRISQVQDWEFKPLPRRLHGLWKGIPINECIGGCPDYATSLVPERWATSAIKDSQFYNLEKDGVYLGFVHEIPIQIGDKVYASLDLMAPSLRKTVLIEDSKGSTLKSKPLFEAWYQEAFTQKPKEWTGFVIGNGRWVDNAGVISTIRALPTYVSSTDLGSAEEAKTLDPLEEKIVNLVPKKDGALVWTHRFQKGHEPPIYRYQGDSGHRSRKGQLSCARSAA